MSTLPDRAASLTIPRLRGNRLFAVLTLVALGASAVFWYWSSRSKVMTLSLGAGVELRYRKGLIDVLCDEASAKGLILDIRPKGRSSEEAVQRVNRGELDAAVIPAGLAIPGKNVRQVAMLECETLHLFVKPKLCAQGVAGLRGRRINLGPPDSGVNAIARGILEFIGMKPTVDYQGETRSYAELTNLPPEKMPDAVFSLSPLPSPLGEKLVQSYGYQLMELPFGEALALRKPYLEDTTVPADTYGVRPAVPAKTLHTVGTRSVLIAHRAVSEVAIRRLLKVLYESDFAHRVGMQPLDATLLHRLGEYPSHAGTIAYLHRNDPWFDSDFIENLERVAGMFLSVISAAFLAWEWYGYHRARGVDDYLRACNRIELNALRDASCGELDPSSLDRIMAQLVELKILVLEKHQRGILPGDQPLAHLLSRIESLQQTLPALVRAAASSDADAIAIPQSQRKAG